MSTAAMIGALQLNIGLRQRLGIYGWAQEQKTRADLIAKYRRYYDGEHDVKMSDAMKRMLRETDANSPFSANYCELVVDKMTDRLLLTGIVADNDAATSWAAGLLRDNRLDALQSSVHESVIKDGDTFMLVDWDAAGRVRLTHEPAYDGSQGVVVLYERSADDMPELAMKVWYTTEFDERGDAVDVARVTVYYKDRIERYTGKGGTMSPVVSDNDIQPGVQKNPLNRVPVIHFKNKGTKVTNYGRSELRAAVPLQNVLNRTLVSMVMTSENTSFQRLLAYNFIPPETVSPGGWIQINDPEGDDGIKAKAEVLESGEIVPFVDQANWVINQMATITSTPLPGWEQAGESGEAKKERQEGLLGKIRRAHTQLGNNWEDTLKLAWEVQSTYGSRPPAYTELTAKWADAQIRNNAEVIANANAVRDYLPKEEYYRILAPVFGWTEDKIKQLSDMATTEEQARLARVGVPTF